MNRLEKKLSPVHVMALAFGCIIGFGAFILPGDKFLPSAGPLGTVLALIIAAIVMMIISLNYNYMINLFPLAGGEFQYANKAFGEKNAFICAWFLCLSYLTLVPMNATALALIGRNTLGNVFKFGFHYTVRGYDVYFGEMLLAWIAILLLGFFSIKGAKVAGRVQIAVTAMLLIGVVALLVATIISPRANLSNAIPAFSEDKSIVSGILVVLAISPFLFVGFDTVPQAAEEFKFPHKKTIFIMIISILFGAFVYATLCLITAMAIPENYSSWMTYIDAEKNSSGLESLPTFNSAHILMGNLGLCVIGIAVLGATLSGMIGFYMATSRLLYSISGEKVIPAWFGEIHKKNGTPHNAILFVLVISMIAPFFGRTVLGWLVDMSSLGAAIGYGYTSLAACKYARENKKTGIIVTGVIGTIIAIVMLLLLLVPIKSLGCSLGKESYICLVVWIVMGIIFYLGSKGRRK